MKHPIDNWLAAAHAAGRAEGLEDAERVAIAFEQRVRCCTGISARIRALASDPVAGDQARNVTAEDVAMFDAALGKSVTVVDEDPAPAPGLAAQEVERLLAIETAAREYLEASRAPFLPTADNFSRHREASAVLQATLSAPRPAQAKEGPME